MLLIFDNGSTQLDSPQWRDVETAIRNLDGNRHTEVGIYVNDDCYLQVGGGGERFVCGIRKGETLYLLTDPTKSKTSMKWVVAGQGANYPENKCFCLEDLLQVARCFWENNSRSTDFHWDSF